VRETWMAGESDRSDDGKSGSGRDTERRCSRANPRMFAGLLDVHNSSGTWGIFHTTACWWDSLKCFVVSELIT
jgi:hypothetical protein